MRSVDSPLYCAGSSVDGTAGVTTVRVRLAELEVFELELELELQAAVTRTSTETTDMTDRVRRPN